MLFVFGFRLHEQRANISSEQLQIVTGVLLGLDVFGRLPTGFEKTLRFACCLSPTTSYIQKARLMVLLL